MAQPPLSISFTEAIDINAIVWIQSLHASEQGPSRRIKEDLTEVSTSGARDFYEMNVSTKNELLNALSDIEKRALAGLRPILHFDMHGSKEGGLQMAPSGEYVPWNGLVDGIRKINIATENNLCCVFATCFALQFAHQVSIFMPTPFYLLIAPKEDVSVGFLEEQTNKFYQSLITSGNINTAYKQTLSKEMSLWNCQSALMYGFVGYHRDKPKDKTTRQRREDALTRFIAAQSISNPQPNQLQPLRKMIKSLVKKEDQRLFNYVAPVFLIGREPKFSFEDLRLFFETDIQFGIE